MLDDLFDEQAARKKNLEGADEDRDRNRIDNKNKKESNGKTAVLQQQPKKPEDVLDDLFDDEPQRPRKSSTAAAAAAAAPLPPPPPPPPPAVATAPAPSTVSDCIFCDFACVVCV